MRPVVLAFALAALALPAAAQLKPLAPAGDPVVAKVNGQEIKRSDVSVAIQNLPTQYQSMPFEALFLPVLNRLIEGHLLAGAAEKAKVGDEPDVKRRVAFARDRILQDVYLNREVEKGLTDAKLRAFYDKQVKEQPPAEEVRARHILVKTEDEAKAALAEITKGADFAEVAKKRSTDGSAAQGGDLGYFTADQMVPEFSKAAFELKKGEVSKAPVKSQFGFHLIKVEDKRTQKMPTFEESKDELRSALAQEVAQGVVDVLRKDAKIETFDANGQPAK
jgi:peptidyl-prolyl cis-trans isomerase C